MKNILWVRNYSWSFKRIPQNVSLGSRGLSVFPRRNHMNHRCPYTTEFIQTKCDNLSGRMLLDRCVELLTFIGAEIYLVRRSTVASRIFLFSTCITHQHSDQRRQSVQLLCNRVIRMSIFESSDISRRRNRPHCVRRILYIIHTAQTKCATI